MNKLSCNAARDLLPLYVDGVLSPETAQEVRRHLETCEKCREEHARLTGTLTLPANESLQQESAVPLRNLKKKVRCTALILVILAAALAAGAWYVSHRLTLRNVSGLSHIPAELYSELTWRDGLVANALAPGEELVSDFEITVNEGDVVCYFMNWTRMSLEMQVGLRASDGVEYASEPVAGGHDDGVFRDLPAGTYRIFLRHAGDYTGVPSWEHPEDFPDVSYDAMCVMNYAIA